MFIIVTADEYKLNNAVKKYYIEANEGDLHFIDSENSLDYIFPIEESIYINNASTNKDLMSISLTSNVIS